MKIKPLVFPAWEMLKDCESKQYFIQTAMGSILVTCKGTHDGNVYRIHNLPKHNCYIEINDGKYDITVKEILQQHHDEFLQKWLEP